jgi:hypothetical protein
MPIPENASLTWKLRQRGTWQSASLTLPASSASRVGCTILREFAGKRSYSPTDLDVCGETHRFSFRSDELVLLIRRLK